MKKEQHSRKRAREMLTRSGYKSGGHVKEKHHEDEAEDKALLKKEMKKAKIKLRHGGHAEGKEPKRRADRLARGGKAKHKGGHSKVTVNVVNAHQQPKPMPVPVPVGGPPPGAGPMPPPGMGAGPGGPMPPPDQGPGPGLKRGGRAKRADGGNLKTSTRMISPNNPYSPTSGFEGASSDYASGKKNGGRAKCAKGGQTSTGRDPIGGMPMGHFKKGGKTKEKFPVPMSGGAGGAKGRLEKAKRYGA